MWHQPFISRFLIFCISTHTSRVGCDTFDKRRAFGISNFYSHIPCGMWQSLYALFCFCKNFYSHIPCGMWQRCLDNLDWSKNISTHTSRVGCDIYANLENLFSSISTHTSRVGCDCMHPHKRKEESNFYSHIPCGMWLLFYQIPSVHILFLLTHPVWDVTWYNLSYSNVMGYFYSHIPCGMWQLYDDRGKEVPIFLLTHPVWDVTLLCSSYVSTVIFLLTHPVWDVTKSLFCFSNSSVFLLTHPVWDVTRFFGLLLLYSLNFYSHIPCGMWLLLSSVLNAILLFLLTHPVWDVTVLFENLSQFSDISTHTSRVGCDLSIFLLRQS